MGLGLNPAELEESRQAGHGLADALKGLNWDETMVQLRDMVKPYVERYREIEAMAPPEHRETARSMVTHEQALYRFAEFEVAGDTSGSLDEIIAQLSYPLPEPV